MKKIGYASFVTLSTLLAGFGMWLNAFGVSAVAGIAVMVLAFFFAFLMPKYLNIVRSANKQSTLLLDAFLGLSACAMMLADDSQTVWGDVVAVALLGFVVADVSVWLFGDKRLSEVSGVETIPYIIESLVVVAFALMLPTMFWGCNRTIALCVLCVLSALTVIFAIAICSSCMGKKMGYYKEMRLGLSLDVVLGCFLVYGLIAHGIDDAMYNVFVLALLLVDAVRSVVSYKFGSKSVAKLL